MYIPFIVWLLLIFAGAIIVFVLVKTAAKLVASLISMVFFVTFLVAGVTAVWLYLDSLDYKEKFEVEDKLFLLSDGSDILTGTVISRFDSIELKHVPADTLDSYESKLKEEKFNEVAGEYWKLYIIDVSAFEDIEDAEIGKITLSKEEYTGIIYGTDYSPIESTTLERENAGAAVFISLLNEASQKDPLFIFEAFKNGKVIIYPESMMLQTIRYIPLWFVDRSSIKDRVSGNVSA